MSAPWFYRAPVSKALFWSTGVASVVALRFSDPTHLSQRFGLDVYKILAAGQIWRLLTCSLPFSGISEMALGLKLLYDSRKFERLMGSEKYGAFLCAVTALSTSLLAGLSLIFDIQSFATGPYSVICAVLMLFHVYVPVTQPRMLRILGVNFSDKSWTYATYLPLLLSGGMSSLLPGLCGTFAGWLYTTNAADVQSWRLPRPVENVFRLLNPLLCSTPPEIPRRRRQEDAGGDNRGGDNTGAAFPQVSDRKIL